MRRNLIIIVCVFLGLLVLMISGNIIIVGEKVATITHLWWIEWVFYGGLLCVFAYLVLLPIWRIHRAPTLPLLKEVVDKEASPEYLKAYGKLLVKHCDYIEDAKYRKEHKEALEEKLCKASERYQLIPIIQDELDLRYNGDEKKGILGINGQIKEWAKSVFMVSAISQNGKFDTISVMWMNLKMIESLVLASGFRPNNRQLFKIYCNVLVTALITYAMSEALTKTGAIHPFDFGDFQDRPAGFADNVEMDDVMNGDSTDVVTDDWDTDFDAQMSDGEGLSLYAILKRIKIPGVVVGSAVDGTVNALMTLRIGYITRKYLSEGEQVFNGIKGKRSVKSQAMIESIKTIPIIVASGSTVIGERASKVIRKVIKNNSKIENYKR